MAIDRELILPLGTGARTVDVWLDRGTHDLTAFAAMGAASIAASAAGMAGDARGLG